MRLTRADGQVETVEDGGRALLRLDVVALRPLVIATDANDLGLAERRLGWRPAVPSAEGLRRTVEWYAAQRAPPNAPAR